VQSLQGSTTRAANKTLRVMAEQIAHKMVTNFAKNTLERYFPVLIQYCVFMLYTHPGERARAFDAQVSLRFLHLFVLLFKNFSSLLHQHQCILLLNLRYAYIHAWHPL
jgi:hypothetical protein